MSNVKFTTIHSPILNKTFYLEVIEDHSDNLERVQWGDYNQSTRKLETGDYGKKNSGGVNMSESIITEDNGFKNINYLPAGTSPMGYIEMLERKYLQEQLNKAI